MVINPKIRTFWDSFFKKSIKFGQWKEDLPI